MSSPGSISAAVVVHNEEAVIERCLQSLHGAVDEIVLVHDGPCDDRTLEIAEGYGCRIFVQPATGSPEQHTVFAYEQCKGEWLLNVDGDEYLSPELRRELRNLTSRPDVNGYWIRWRIWNGERYVTERGPFKLVLFRARAAHLIGMNENWEQVEGRVERVHLDLHHEPRYDSTSLRANWPKWRKRARVQAGQYLSDFSALPKFNYRGPQEWSRKRRVLNALSPLIVIPYGLATFAIALARENDYYSLRQNLRFATYQGLYNAMVMYYVARAKYMPSRMRS
ncbi:MAG TPA: glycosyltransferase [Thermoleophilaceae bacterium]|nr:glycosyltransferase [Thermoleophilaceae bacterium]